MAWNAAAIPDQTGRTVIVTGASSGLGSAAALELARKGATVVLAVRDPTRGQRASDGIRALVPGASLELRTLDLASLDAVREFARAIAADHHAIDTLLNNAGVMATPPRETADGLEFQVGTNHLGHFALTALLMPLLEEAGHARIVTMTSFARHAGRPLTLSMVNLGGGYDAWQAYADSKLANYHFAIELARRLDAAGSSVASFAAHPGLSDTNLQVAAAEGHGAGRMGSLWQGLARHVGMPPEQGCLSMLRAATDPDARNGQAFGPRWIAWGAPTRDRVSQRSAAVAAGERLWQVSETATSTPFHVAQSALG